MTKYVIGPDVALRLAREDMHVASNHSLLAPTLMRSQLLSLLYRSVGAGDMTKADADRCLGYVRNLRVRLLGDRVLQEVAWTIAERLGWPDTLDAEYLALTKLQADAFITLDRKLAATAKQVVAVAPIGALSKK